MTDQHKALAAWQSAKRALESNEGTIEYLNGKKKQFEQENKERLDRAYKESYKLRRQLERAEANLLEVTVQ